MAKKNQQPVYGTKQYKAGLNSRGLPTNRKEPPKVTTERGKRRVARGKKKHEHEFYLQPVTTNSSYDSNRVALEQFYHCRGCGFRTKNVG
jgi:hypothetical protein